MNFNWETTGCVLILRWSCPNKHFGKWESAEELCVKNNNKVYSINMMLASAVLFSGNNYGKIKNLFDLLNLHIITQTSYNFIQKLYCVPAVSNYWDEMKKVMISTFKPYSELCLCGDARNDSPGHSAK